VPSHQQEEYEMTKSKSPHNAKQAAAAKKPRKIVQRGEAVSPKQRANSKQADVINKLRRSEGATISAIMKMTGWQQHSVRGFFAGVVRKKLGLTLESQKPKDGERIYRIVAGKPGNPKSKAAKPNRRAA
jgi:hypothetical protein